MFGVSIKLPLLILLALGVVTVSSCVLLCDDDALILNKKKKKREINVKLSL
jgi:hypothetical protein